MSLLPYLKAIAAAVTSFGGAYAVAVQDGGVSTAEWISIAVTVVVATAAVFGVPNKDPEATHQAQSVQPPQA